jgi:hypothetical protein
MHALDRFLLAFRRDVTRAAPHDPDHYVRLYWDDRDAFLRAQDAAWAARTPEPFVSLTKVQAANEALSAKTAGRLANRFISSSRFAEAVDVLRDQRHGLGRGSALDLARAELGRGRIEEAAAVLAQAEVDPRSAEAAEGIEAAIAGIRSAQKDFAASGDWPACRALFDLWIEAGSPETAFDVLMSAINAGVPLPGEDRTDFHEALDLALSLHRPPSAYNLFRALEQLPRYANRSERLEATCRWVRAASAGAENAGPLDIGRSRAFLGGSAAMAVGASGETRAAVETLGALTLAYPKLHYLKHALTLFVGRDVLASHPLRYGPAGPRRVFDVFIFNNELRLLQLKLHEMADWVDAFVLVEARRTFTGAPKPLVFDENRAQFAAFASKIIHVVVDEFPPYVRHPWAREFYQRDIGIKGLDGRCQEDDLVIISDADEVASREAVLGFKGEYAWLGMERMRYFLNYRQVLSPAELKPHAGLWRAKYLRSLGLSRGRVVLMAEKRARCERVGGWHFTSIADAPGIVHKLNHTAHQEHAGADAEAVAAHLAQIRSGVPEPGWERVELDERFPAYLRENRAAFEDVLL